MLLVKYLKLNHIPLRVMGKEEIQSRSEKMVYWVVRRPGMADPDCRDPGKGFASSEAKDGRSSSSRCCCRGLDWFQRLECCFYVPLELKDQIQGWLGSR